MSLKVEYLEPYFRQMGAYPLVSIYLSKIYLTHFGQLGSENLDGLLDAYQSPAMAFFTRHRGVQVRSRKTAALVRHHEGEHRGLSCCGATKNANETREAENLFPSREVVVAPTHHRGGALVTKR